MVKATRMWTHYGMQFRVASRKVESRAPPRWQSRVGHLTAQFGVASEGCGWNYREARPDMLEDESGEPAGGEGLPGTYVELPAGSPDPYNGAYRRA